MGSQQGRACAGSICQSVAGAGLADTRSRWPRLSAFASGPIRGRGAAREIIRHYTHLSERIDGLAHEAGVPTASLLELHLRMTIAGAGAEPLLEPAVLLVATGLDGAPGLSLVRGLPGTNDHGSPWLVRRSEPEVGFASLDLTLPWLATAVAGVNTCGLCVMWLPGVIDGAVESDAPPFPLLVQECLQRFENVAAAVDWCTSRHASGHGAIVLADAAGAVARVEAIRCDRHVHLSEELPLALGRPIRLAETLLETARHEGLLDEKALAVRGGSGSPIAFVRLTSTDRGLQLKRLESPVQEVVLRL